MKNVYVLGLVLIVMSIVACAPKLEKNVDELLDNFAAAINAHDASAVKSYVSDKAATKAAIDNTRVLLWTSLGVNNYQFSSPSVKQSGQEGSGSANTLVSANSTSAKVAQDSSDFEFALDKSGLFKGEWKIKKWSFDYIPPAGKEPIIWVKPNIQ